MDEEKLADLQAANQRASRLRHKRTRRFAILFVTFLIGFSFTTTVSLMAPAGGAGLPYEASSSALPLILTIITALGSIVTAIGTLSSVVLGWRKDKRETKEFARRLAELEAKQAER